MGTGPAWRPPGQAPTYHQVLQGQRLVLVPQDLDFPFVGQLGGWEATRLPLQLLNDLQALIEGAAPAQLGLGGTGHQEPTCSLSSSEVPPLWLPFLIPHLYGVSLQFSFSKSETSRPSLIF